MTSEAATVSLFSPAKVNVFLAITGLRDDGFHDLISLVAPLKFGDTLTVSLDPNSREDVLECDDDAVPLGAENLILKAAQLFRKEAALSGGFKFDLKKQIPMGAGLGGGSSNAVAALKGMNQLIGKPLPTDMLHTLASQLGSDCPLFFYEEPVLMKGRGEQIEKLPSATLDLLRGQEIILFKPHFSVSTIWAYKQMKAANGAHYCDKNEILSKCTKLFNTNNLKNIPYYNNLQNVVFEKYLALPTIQQELAEKHHFECLMSGSGSSCFGFLKQYDNSVEIMNTIRSSLGEDSFVVKTSIIE